MHFDSVGNMIGQVADEAISHIFLQLISRLRLIMMRPLKLYWSGAA